MYVGLSCRFPEPTRRANHPVLSIVTLVKFWHTMGGLYIWEYFTTLDYEWSVIRGHLPYRWTIWIYSLARLAALMSVILCFVTVDVTTQINCQFWVLFSAILLFLSSTTASLLIVLRTYVFIHCFMQNNFRESGTH
ncbi:hypothetical protein F5888DRAFT_636321 [Russula emetica]|nr:hypothetical protein F5888DRAFT_636321 [Russula emetica]